MAVLRAIEHRASSYLREDFGRDTRLCAEIPCEVPLYSFHPETPDDWWEVENLYDTCFAPGRTALSSYRLRNGVDPVAGLCVLARDQDGVLAAAIRYWPAKIGDAPVLLLGPIAVHPIAQGEGLGGALIRETLEKARHDGHERVLLVGDQPYYARFGFSRLFGVVMPPPTNPERILGVALKAGAWVNVTGAVSRWATPEG